MLDARAATRTAVRERLDTPEQQEPESTPRGDSPERLYAASGAELGERSEAAERPWLDPRDSIRGSQISKNGKLPDLLGVPGVGCRTPRSALPAALWRAFGNRGICCEEPRRAAVPPGGTNASQAPPHIRGPAACLPSPSSLPHNWVVTRRTSSCTVVATRMERASSTTRSVVIPRSPRRSDA